MSFWVRMCAGFVALSQATSQALLSTGGSIADPANPFGHHSQTSIALCIGTGVSGAFFCALSEPAGAPLERAPKGLRGQPRTRWTAIFEGKDHVIHQK